MSRRRRPSVSGPEVISRPSKRPRLKLARKETSLAAAGAYGKARAATSRLTAEELEYFRGLLLAKRRELVGDVEQMSREALGENRRDAAGDLSIMPLHMADIGTDNFEQEFTLGLIHSERQLVREIDAALARLRDGTYGVCAATQRRISKARLRAQPWARFCVQYVRELERNGRR